MDKVAIGISACLLGNPVRYNGGHKKTPYITDTLGKLVRWVPICPEAECGLGVPREPMHLEGDPDSPRLITNESGIDYTGKLVEWTAIKLDELHAHGLSGFVFKARSPSCAPFNVEGQQGGKTEHGSGLFARAFIKRFPLLPVIDEERILDPAIRLEFLIKTGVRK